jgi:hypothetical protein
MMGRTSRSGISRVVRGIKVCGGGILVLGCSLSLLAQTSGDKDKKEENGQAYSGKTVQVAGTVRCEKADPGYAIDVPDRAGHALTLAHRKCLWIEPWTIAGTKPKDAVEVSFAEQMEGIFHYHGYEIDTLDTGDHITFRMMGQIPAEKAPVDGKGRWSFMRGTGKFKGIQGGGTYEEKLAADESLTLKFEGVYVPAEMAAGQK